MAMVPDPDDIVRALAGGRICSRLQSNNNHVYTRGDHEVIKFSVRPERYRVIIDEASVVTRLNALGLPVPPVIEVLHVGELPIVVYERFHGEPGRTPEHYRRCGEFLAHLEAIADRTRDLGGETATFGGDELASRLRKHELLDDRLAAGLRHMFELDRRRMRSFCHPDYGGGQVLFDRRGDYRVVDWEGAGAGNPCYALGRFCAMIAEYGRGPKQTFIDACIAGALAAGFTADRAEIEAMRDLSDLRDAHWKLEAGDDHRRHAHALVAGVRARLSLRA
jgi:aminoglycoside phosphotransferase (APT) family kinase protein